MTIRTIEGTEVRRGSCVIAQVEISDPATPRAFAGHGWEFSCDACDAFGTGLAEEEARAELAEHVCPDVPPCEAMT